MPKITDYPADTAPDGSDVIPFVDVSAGATEKVTVDNLAASTAFSGRYVAVPTAWTAVTFENSWVNFGGALVVCSYRKVGDVVQLRGMMKSGTIGLTSFTLPAGFRPVGTEYYVVTAGSAFGDLTIDSAGVVKVNSGSNAYVSLGGITFSVTA